MENPINTAMPTLSESMTKAQAKGFTENFKIASKGLTTDEESRFYAPEEIKISNFYRFEGNSDPMDNCILYLIETPDGKKGVLVDAYGAYADAKVSKFIRDVEDIQKKARK